MTILQHLSSPGFAHDTAPDLHLLKLSCRDHISPALAHQQANVCVVRIPSEAGMQLQNASCPETGVQSAARQCLLINAH